MEDHYGTLGVRPDASRVELERAYRRLARAYHPDLMSHAEPAARGAAEATLKRINAAYAILGSPRRRLGYDREYAASRATYTAARRVPATPRAQPAATTAHWHGGGPVMMEWSGPWGPAPRARRAEFRWLHALLWAAAMVVLFALVLALLWRPTGQIAPVPLPTPVR